MRTAAGRMLLLARHHVAWAHRAFVAFTTLADANAAQGGACDTAFVRQPNFTFGNAGRNLVVAPARRNLDLALYKAFRFGENRSLQLRGEFFNATNTPFFDAPGNSLGVSQFGVINGAFDARIAQVAAKLYF